MELCIFTFFYFAVMNKWLNAKCYIVVKYKLLVSQVND